MSLYRHYMILSERWAKLRAKLPPITVTLGGGWRWRANYTLSVICRAMPTMNGVLITVTVDVKTTTEVQIITHCPGAMAHSMPLLAFAQTADTASRELLLRLKPFFRRIYGNSFRTRLRQLMGLAEANQVPEFRGTQFSISRNGCRRNPAPRGWSGTRKMLQGNGLSSLACLPAPSTPDILHQMYPYVLWWAADLVATPQQKFPVGSPSGVKVRSVPVEQAPRVLEASTLLLVRRKSLDK